MTNKEFAELIVRKIEHHKHKLCDGKSDPVTAAYAQAHVHIIELINILTPSEVEEPVAHIAYWIRKKIDKSHYNYYCNHCYYKSKQTKSKFCPGCGYLMSEEDKDIET